MASLLLLLISMSDPPMLSMSMESDRLIREVELVVAIVVSLVAIVVSVVAGRVSVVVVCSLSLWVVIRMRLPVDLSFPE